MKKIALPRLTHVVLIGCLIALAGCSSLGSNYTRGYQLQEGALDQVPVGATKEQVQFVLGTPSTTSSIDGETYYYISQNVDQKPFFEPSVTDQRVIAIYFDKNSRVERIANYGLEDGKVFDFVSRTTPTGGKDTTFLQQIFTNLVR